MGLDQRQARHLPPQHALEQILRHAVVLLEIVFADGLAAGEDVPMLVHQALVGGHAGGRHFRRQEALRAQLIDAAPEIEALERALREVLAPGNLVHSDAALHQRAGNAAQPEIDREPDADRPAADDDDLTSFPQDASPRRGPFTRAGSKPCPALSSMGFRPRSTRLSTMQPPAPGLTIRLPRLSTDR